MNRDLSYTPDVVDAHGEAWRVFTATLDVEALELERWSRGVDALSVARDERFGAVRHQVMVHHHELRARAFRVQVEREWEGSRRVFEFTDAQLAVAMRVLDAQEGVVRPVGAVSAASVAEHPSEGSRPVRKRFVELQSERGAA